MLEDILPNTIESDDNSNMVFDQETGEWYDMSIIEPVMEVEHDKHKTYFEDFAAINRDYENYLYNR